MNLEYCIQKSNSQALQDVFALYTNGFSSNGYFVDLGCGEPIKINNTALLEEMGWKGFLVDYSPSFVAQCNYIRKCQAVHADLTKKNVTELLDAFNAPPIIDYVSLDLDHGAAWDCIKRWDFSKYKIRSITFEHDYYDGGANLRKNSRELLEQNGMLMVCSDVTIFGGKSFEDWYVNPDLVPREIYNPIIGQNIEYNDVFKKLC